MFINESEERLEEVARSFRTAVLSRDSTPRRAGGGKKNGRSKDIRFQRKGGVRSSCLKSGGTKLTSG